VPDEPFDTSEPWFAITCGMLLSSVSALLAPCSFASVFEMVETGDVDVRPFCGMREPVTTTFSTASSCA